MAAEIVPGFAASISSLVNDELNAVRDVRGQQNAEQDLKFQEAISNGMSADDQVKYLTKELSDERSSPISDVARIDQLQTQLTQVKASARMSDYETAYKDNLAKLAAGKMTAQQNLDFLNGQLNATTDPSLRAEIQSNIVEANKEVLDYNNTILQNDQQRAVTSKSTSILQSAIDETKSHLATMLSNGNEALAAVDRASLANLNGQLGSVTIQNSLNDVAVRSIAKGTGAAEKLSFLDGQIQNADATTPVTVNGQDYASAQQYWSQLKGAYLSGNNSNFATASNDFGVFSSFFNEQQKNIEGKIAASIKTNGFATSAVIDDISKQLTTISQNPDMAAYAQQFQTLSDTVIGTAVDSMAKTIVDDASLHNTNSNYATADAALTALGQRYGVNTDAYRVLNADKLKSYLTTKSSQTGIDPASILKDEFPALASGDSQTITPPSVPTTSTTPAVATTPPNQSTPSGGTHTVAAGETLSSIAAKNNTTTNDLLAANPSITDPNKIGIGQQLNIPGSTATPSASEGQASTSVTPPIVPPSTTTSVTPSSTPSTPSATSTPTPTPSFRYGQEYTDTQGNKQTAKFDPMTGQPLQQNTPDVSAPPVPSATQSQTTPPPPSYNSYTIAHGDTLGAIAARNGTTISELMAANPNITNANRIQTGANINIPK